MDIIVIENNSGFNKLICQYINQVLIEKNYDYKIIPFFSYNNDLKKIIHNKEIKIYIIDIKLGQYSGYDICREIRELAYDWDSIIIISSIHNQKENLISLRLSIFTYLSKLLNFEVNLKETISYAIDILQQNKFLIINKHCKIAINDICYILKERNSKYCFIKTLDSEFRIRKSLKKLDEELKLTRIKNYLLINDRNTKVTTKNRIIFENKIEIKID